MANVNVSGLPAAVSVATADTLMLVQGGCFQKGHLDAARSGPGTAAVANILGDLAFTRTGTY